MQPYIGKRSHGPVCRYGCCFAEAKCQPHYRKPNSREKTLSRRIARARARRSTRLRAEEAQP